MELLPTWWLSSLAHDHHVWLRQKEVKSLPPYRCRSPQLQSRLYVVDWLAVICDSSGICLTARHLAVLLLDYFMDNHHVERSQLKLIALCALHIAAKFEECETNIPKITQLKQLASSPGLTPHQFLEVEVKMLEFFSWNINLPTAAHFYDYYLVDAVVPDDMYNGRCVGDETSVVAVSMAKYVTYFLEVSLQDHIYRAYLPSLVCAACIASSRNYFRIMPTWPLRLQQLTGYFWADLQDVVQHLMRSHERDDIQRKSRSSQSVESQDNMLVVNSKSQCNERSVLEPQASKPIMYYISPAASGSAHSSYFLAPSDTKIALKGSYAL